MNDQILTDKTEEPPIEAPGTMGKELLLLGLLSLLWGSTYLFAKVALGEIPPLTLTAARVSIAAMALTIVMSLQGHAFPHTARPWRMLLVQAIFNSIGAWTVLAWGEQFSSNGLATVLNSASPLFVFLFAALLGLRKETGLLKLVGATAGFGGVLLIVGIEARAGLDRNLAARLAAIIGAALMNLPNRKRQ